jgi:hypothetical protein
MQRMDCGKILAVDDRYLSADLRVRTTVHPFEKDTENPVWDEFSDWEIPGSVPGLVFPDPVTGDYRMFFGTYHHEMGAYPTGMATSKDGLSWRKHPRFLDDRDYVGIDRKYQGMSVCHQPEGVIDGYRFFASVIFREDMEKGLPFRVHFKRSRDGLAWEWLERERYWDGCSDVINVIWDTQQKRFVSYHKLWRVVGVDAAGEAFRGYFTAFTADETGDGKVRVAGNRLFCDAADSSVDRQLLLGEQATGDGGGGFTTDVFQMVRVVARAESSDYVNWENNTVILEPGPQAEIDEQSYGMPVFQYAGMYIGLPRNFRGQSGKLNVRTAWSTDGISFTAPDVDTIDCGAPGTWDCGMVLAAAEPLVLGDRMCVYYGGYDIDHSKPGSSFRMRPGRAWLRLDGFASRTGGVLRSRPLQSTARSLRVNGTGSIGVSVESVAGTVLHTAAWRGDATDACVIGGERPLHEEAFRIRFDLKAGELFSFRLE